MANKFQTLTSTACAAITLAYGTAYAEQYGRKEDLNVSSEKSAYDNFDVMSRRRPEYEAKGIRKGSIIAYPQIETGLLYNDNIQATRSNKLEDIAAIVTPKFRLASDFNNHELNFEMGGQVARFFDETDESFENFETSIDGRLDITRDFNVTAGASYGFLNEDRTSALAPVATEEPVEFQEAKAFVGLNKTFNRLDVQTSVDVTNLDYDDARNSANAIVDQDDRDLVVGNLNGRLSYNFSPGYDVFAQGTASKRNYYNVTNSAEGRDSVSYRATTGVSAELTNLLVGEVEVGYTRREFDNFSDVDAVVWGTSLNWFPTPLLTGRFGVDRNVIDGTTTIGVGTSAIVQTRYAAEFNYEVLRNYIVSPSFQYIDGDYEGAGQSGDEETFVYGIRGDLFINNNFSLQAKYEYSERDSTVSILNYERNFAFISLKTKI